MGTTRTHQRATKEYSKILNSYFDELTSRIKSFKFDNDNACFVISKTFLNDLALANTKCNASATKINKKYKYYGLQYNELRTMVFKEINDHELLTYKQLVSDYAFKHLEILSHDIEKHNNIIISAKNTKISVKDCAGFIRLKLKN